MASEPVERQRYGDYEVESRLGRGSVGMVYLARHRRLNRRVALKVMQFDQTFETNEDRVEFEARLQREAELCASLLHPNIVTLYEAGYEGEVISYLATEYVDGETLQARLKRTRPLPLQESLAIATDLLRGLAYAHSREIIHRDIKPANIFLTSNGRAKIGDFGVARPVNSNLTMSGSLIGTPNYMSPEQVRTTAVTTRSDLFSAGTVLYEILTGVRPYASPELSGILYNVVQLVPPAVHQVNAAVPDAVGAVVMRLMAKDPAQRYATADEPLEELERIRASFPAAAPVPQPSSFDDTTPIPTDRGLSALAATVEVESPEELSQEDLLPEIPTVRSRRRVPDWLFWVVTLSLSTALAATIQQIRVRTDATPRGVITAEQLREFDAKKRALGDARILVAAGRLDEALLGYDAYLTRYPISLVARQERDGVAARLAALKAAAEAAEEAKKRRAGTGRSSSRSSRGTTADNPDEPQPTEVVKPPSRWQRVKRWLQTDPSKKPAPPPAPPPATPKKKNDR